MLNIRNFSKRFSDHLVLEISQLSFDKGAYWIKGENGSGKTTFFKSIAGILPFDGEITFDDGIDIKKDAVAFRRRVSYCEAEPLYPGFLTAKDLVRFIGKARGASRQQQEHYCAAMGVDQFFNKPTETYSSGMMKKLALAMAFLGEPQIIILDEPIITLDEQTRSVLFGLVAELLNHHKTFLISSHHAFTPVELPVQATFLLENKTILAL